jgi:hypothetical protein
MTTGHGSFIKNYPMLSERLPADIRKKYFLAENTPAPKRWSEGVELVIAEVRET